jgi:hypothetical protein
MKHTENRFRFLPGIQYGLKAFLGGGGLLLLSLTLLSHGATEAKAQGYGNGGIPAVLQALDMLEAEMDGRLDNIESQLSTLAGTVAVIESVQDDMQANTADHPMDMDVVFCFNLGGSLGAETGVNLLGKLAGKGGIGADVYGNGADADLEVSGSGGQTFTVGGEGGIEAEACVKGWTIKSGEVLTAAQQSIVDDLKNNAVALRDNTVGVVNAFNISSGKFVSAADLLQNLDLDVGNPAAILNASAGAFGGMASVLPLNSNVSAALSNPSNAVNALGEKLSDHLGTLCSTPLGSGLGSIFDSMCEGEGQILATTLGAIQVAVDATKPVVGWIKENINWVKNQMKPIYDTIKDVCGYDLADVIC